MTDVLYQWLCRIDLSESPDASNRFLVSVQQTPFARVSENVADILRHAQRDFPRVSVEGIAASLGVDAHKVEGALLAIGESPMLRASERRSASRLQFRAPFAIQFTLFDPSAVLGRSAALGHVVRSRWWWRAQIGISIVGALALVLLSVSPNSPLHQPMTGGQYIAVFVALFLTVFVHEFAHAAVLVGYGGQTHRLGVMLFYLAPAFFCDVSDAWRLPSDQRVRVALAGVLAQASLAGLASLAALLLPPSAAVAFAVFALLCLLYAIVNLIPFVKLDAYVALVGFLDRPNLRASAITAFHASLTRSSTNRSRGRGSLIVFGFACAVFPVVLVVGAGLAVNSYLASWGVVGAWVTLVVFVVILSIGIVMLWRAVWRSFRGSVPSIRGLAVVGATAAVIGAAAFLLPLPQQTVGGVIDSGNDRVLAIASATSTIPPDSQAAVYASAVFPSRRIATARVIGGPHACAVPLEAVAPIAGTGMLAKAQCYPVAVSGHLSGTTVAVLEGRGVALVPQLAFLFDRLVTAN